MEDNVFGSRRCGWDQQEKGLGLDIVMLYHTRRNDCSCAGHESIDRVDSRQDAANRQAKNVIYYFERFEVG